MFDDSLINKTCEYCGASRVMTFATENGATYAFECTCYDDIALYGPDEIEKHYENNCWNCKAKIDSRVCIQDRDPQYGYICKKCSQSLRNYFKLTG